MMDWIKIGKTESEDGSTVFYKLPGTKMTIESRKRKIPHANGIGTWEHTTYFVLEDGEELVELYSLKDAKIFAEEVFRTSK